MASDPVDTLEQQNGGEHGCLSPPVAPIIGATDPESRLVADIQERLRNVSLLYPDCCIYRVPERLRKINEAAYTPQIVSIGPFHHGKENLKVQETLKWQHLSSFVGRNPNVTLSQYVTTIEGIEKRIRDCYAEIISFSSDEFVRMMLVDGCFILEYMFRIIELKGQGQWFDNPWFLKSVQRDLLLLENQLPLFVLEDLYELNGGGNRLDFTVIIRVFSSVFPNTGEREQLREKSKGKCSQKAFVCDHYRCSSSSCSSHGLPTDNNTGEGADPAILSTVVDMPETTRKRHLLDFVRDCFNPSSSPQKKGNSEEQLERPSQDKTKAVDQMHEIDDASSRLLYCTSLLYLWKQKICFISSSSSAANALLSGHEELHQRPHNVTALYKTGVKFVVGRGGKGLLDVSFENGVLAIPCIYINDRTESLLRNMIAFEQLYCVGPPYSRYITDYAYLLDSLIDTSKDVELLHDHGIIKNCLGDHEEVSLLFNKLVKEVIFDDGDDNYYFYRLCKKLNAYHRFWHEWVADLRQTYFNTPWTAISVIAAAVLIVLTILQTIYTIKSYTKQ